MPTLRCVLGFAVLALCSCEGQTSLHISPCFGEGQTQACSDPCGQGVQTCRGGSWTACFVEPVRVACSDPCGPGTQLCEDGKLQGSCAVDPVVEDCSTVCGPGTRTCSDGKWQACTAHDPKPAALTATIRDFHNSFPDMDHDGIAETGIVADTLGSDDKPVYAHDGPTATVSGPDSFNQWYRDVPGVNVSTTMAIPLSASSAQPDVYGYRNTSFFPIDNQLFGNEGLAHNYSFTAEIATFFHYNGGETFTFSGDDDVFVFINRTLAIDLGGIHSSLSASVDLDQQAARLGIAKGGVYSMHIFFAERHPVGSDFVLQTTISEFDLCE